MNGTIPYHADRDSLYYPYKNATFFQGGEPKSDAWLCAEMSRLAYVKAEDNSVVALGVRTLLASVGFTECDFFDENGTQCFVARGDDLLVLSFRGTEKDDPTDLAVDAQAWL